MTLNDLKSGDSATVVGIRGGGAFRKRLSEMGFVRGIPVTVIKSAPLKDPVEYRLLDFTVSLRRSEASLVEVITGVEERKAVLRENSPLDPIFGARPLAGKGRIIDVALVGNPNCGKTTLFNRVSGSREHVGNYSGVTVSSKRAYFSHRGYTFNITDLPGTYSLSDYSEEEKFVRDHLFENKPDVVVNVVDASNLERNLYLTSQLLDMNITVVLALNMYDDLLARNDKLDIGLLSKLLGVRVVPTISHRGKGIYRLLNHVIRVHEGKDPDIRDIRINYGEEIEESVERLQEMIGQTTDLTHSLSSRFLALKLLEEEEHIPSLLNGSVNSGSISGKALDEGRRLRNLFREDPATLITDARYGFIAGALKETMKKSGMNPGMSRSDRIDRILTHKILGLPIFLGFLWLMFHATFTLGNYPMGWIESGVEILGNLLKEHLADGILRDLLVDGVIGGVGGVLVFLPNILILFFFISLMEDTGYMARTTFIMDRVMHLFGLHGKSFIPMIMGFGCNVPAIMATRTLENKKDRILTMLIIPFMSCSARLPVYVLIAGAIFPKRAGTVIFLLYLTGVLFSFLMSVLFRNILFRNSKAPFVMELPVYRSPGFRLLVKHMWRKGSHYLRKMGGVILIASVVIWALGYFPRNPELATQSEKQEQSYIGQMGKAMEPVLRPLGFDWRMGISLITGFAAKEIVVSTMGVLYQVDDGVVAGGSASLQDRIREQVYTSGPKRGEAVFTPLSGFSFLLFVLFYLPCIAVITAVGKESGSWKWAGFVLFYTTAIAWLASFAVYQVGNIMGYG